MGKINRHIEIVSSTSTFLSSMSKPSRDAIQKALSKHYSRVGITIVNNQSDLDGLVAKAPDLVLLGMKFIPGCPTSDVGNSARIWLAEYLVEHGIAVTGSLSSAHRMELNKPLAKKCLLYDGLKTTDYYVAEIGQPLTPELISIDYPLFVKPTDRGGGAGIDSDSVVNNFSELKSKVGSIASNLNSNSLIEKYLPGREFSVAILRNTGHTGYTTMPLEIIAPGNEQGVQILSGAAKSANAEAVKEVTDTKIKESVADLALSAFRSIGGRDYGRIDIRMDENDVPHFLEANLIPSLIDQYGSFPKACALNISLGYKDMLLHIVELGMARSNTMHEMRQPLLRIGDTLSGAYS